MLWQLKYVLQFLSNCNLYHNAYESHTHLRAFTQPGGLQGSVFSALLTDMMEAVMGPTGPTPAASAATSAATPAAANPVPAPQRRPEAAAVAGASPRSSPTAAGRALMYMTSSSALNPKNSPTAKVSARAEKIATVALAAHPFRPIYLSGELYISTEQSF